MLNAIKVLCLLTVSAALTYLLIESSLLVRDIRREMLQVSATLSDAQKSVAGLNSAVEIFHDAEAKQAAFYDPARPGGLPQQIQRTIVDIKHLVGRTDFSLNGGPGGVGVLPQLTKTLADTSMLTRTAATDLDDTATKLQPVILDLTTAAKGASDAMNDPAIHGTLENAQSASKEFAGMAADGHTETGILVGATREAFKPKNKFLAIINGLSNGTLTAAELLYYLHHQP